MKILLYSDAHFSLNSSILLGTTNSLEGRLNHLIESFRWMYGIAKERKVDRIIDLGDLVDDFRLTAEEITAVTEALTMNDFVEEIHILGNHERLAEDGTINSVNFVDAIPYHRLVREIEVNEKEGITYIPYCKLEESILSPLPHTKFAFTHLDIFGSDMGAGFVLKAGIKPATLLEKYDYVLNGHVHVHGYLVDFPDQKVINFGALSGQNFSSQGSPHIAILDTDTADLEFIDNPKALYFVKGNCDTVSDVLKLLNGMDPELDYALQLRVPMSISDEVRDIISKKKYILSGRVRVEPDKSQLEASEDAEIEKVSSTSGGFIKLREFVERREELPFDKDDVFKVINEIESNTFAL